MHISIGSPPRVRGTASNSHLRYRRHRITPACAGNRRPAACIARSPWDHPRVCGEQPFSSCQANATIGSPPRVRGTDTHIVIRLRKSRITPACAGNSAESERLEALYEDHPRVCGEQPRRRSSPCACCGSPPRVRGTDDRYLWPEMLRGITPACAGNSYPAFLPAG